jgi:hypothetical protein
MPFPASACVCGSIFHLLAKNPRSHNLIPMHTVAQYISHCMWDPYLHA